jgi:hypothetical protein
MIARADWFRVITVRPFLIYSPKIREQFPMLIVCFIKNKKNSSGMFIATERKAHEISYDDCNSFGFFLAGGGGARGEHLRAGYRHS